MQKKKKIICFHGFGGNGDLMKRQMRHIQKSLEKSYDFYYPNGVKQLKRSHVTDQNMLKLLQGNPFTWFDQRNVSQGQLIQITFNKIIKQINQNGPFEGIIGFSQGGLFAWLIIRILKLKLFDYKKLNDVKFAIFICSPMTKWRTIQKQQNPIQFPNLHILSTNDLTFFYSITLTTKFIAPQIIFHSEGHKIPKLNYADQQRIKKFILNATKANEKKKNYYLSAKL